MELLRELLPGAALRGPPGAVNSSARQSADVSSREHLPLLSVPMARVTIALIGRPLYASSRSPHGGCVSSAFPDPNHRNGAWKFAEHAFQYLDANWNPAGNRLY